VTHHAIEQFAKHFKRPPDRLTLEHLRAYQAYLLRERKLGPRTVRLHVAHARFAALGLSPEEEKPPPIREVVRLRVDDEGREIQAS